jgi:creatinine amidohydrolase
MAVHEWRSLSWPAFRALPAGTVIAVLPLGALEAHGPHLPLGTDMVIAEAMARAGADRLSRRGFTPVLLPTMPVAPAPFASDFAGTIDAPAAATTALLSAVAQSAGRHGARATVVANAHHDPAHVCAIREAVEEVQARRAAPLIFPDLTRRRWAERLTDEFKSGACHAGRYEGSVVLACQPDLVDAERMAGLPHNPRSLVDAIARGDRTFQQADGHDAYFGWPSQATADEGRDIIERLGAILEEAVVDGLAAQTSAQTSVSHHRASSGGGHVELVNPESLGRPRGFSHGVVGASGGRFLAVAGQTAANEHGQIAEAAFADQFAVALRKVVDVVRAAGGEPSDIVRMTVFVTDLDVYRASRSRLGEIWRPLMGRHYPAMALVGVAGLVDRGATVEIQADAVLSPRHGSHIEAADRR